MVFYTCNQFLISSGFSISLFNQSVHSSAAKKDNNFFYAGYFGSTLGGYTYDTMGFENSTLVVIAMQILALVAIFGIFYAAKITRIVPNEETTQALLSSKSA